MRKILLLFTGGTIASIKTERGLEPVLNAEQIMSYLPEISEDIHLGSRQICNLDSTDIEYHHWLEMAAAIEEDYERYDGYVICHGTDTMAYTAAALSYLIQNSMKPIILTGSQQPIQMEITDAKKNLYDSIVYAADEESSGVNIIFDGKVIAGTRAKKTMSFSYRAFSSINFPEIASMQHGKIVRYITSDAREDTPRFYHSMNPRVFTLKITPGMAPAILRTIFETYDGIIVESFGVGGMPGSMIEDFRQLMKEYEQHPKVIVMTTQVTYEGSNLSTYEVGERIKGCFPYLEAYDMNSEAVLTKLMWILGQENMDYHKIETLFYRRINHDVLI